MWQGSFEREESGDGRRVYRLRWRSGGQLTGKESSLTEREIRGGLFIRYLIGKGILSEMWDDSSAVE